MKLSVSLILVILFCTMLISCNCTNKAANNEKTTNKITSTQQAVSNEIYEVDITNNEYKYMLNNINSSNDDIYIFSNSRNSRELYIATKDINKNYFNPTYNIKNKDLILDFDYKKRDGKYSIHLYKLVLRDREKYDGIGVTVGNGNFKGFRKKVLNYYQ